MKTSEEPELQQPDDLEEEESAPQAYEGVPADDFAAFAESVVPAIQGGAAAMFVLVWAVFFCAGIMAVQTLVRSLEG